MANLRALRDQARTPLAVVPVLTGVMALLLVLANDMEHVASARSVVRVCCVVTTDQAWPVMLARLPGSVVAAAPSLPVWGAVAQVLIVVGAAEIMLGWRRTVAVGLSCHVASTLVGRAAWDTARSLSTSGLAGMRDTGPSAFVLGLAIYLIWALAGRRWGLVALVVVACSALAWRDLAALEHLVAAGLAALIAARHARAPIKVSEPRSSSRPTNAVVMPVRRRVRAAGLGLTCLIAVAASWHTYHPLSPTQVTSAPGGMTAVAFTDEALLPVRVDPPQVDEHGARSVGYWSASPTCSQPLKRNPWVWRHVWWCRPTNRIDHQHPGLEIRYWIGGVPQTIEVPPRHSRPEVPR